MRMKRRVFSTKDRILMVRMREGGMRCKDVANCFEVSSSTVSTVLKKWKDTGTCEEEINDNYT